MKGTLGLLLSLALVSATPLQAQPESPGREAPVEISPYLLGSGGPPVHGDLVLRRTSGAATEPGRIPLTALSAVTLKLPAGSIWQVSGDLAGFWIPPKALVVGAPDSTTRLKLGLWPKGTISGGVKVKEKGVKTPSVVLVEVLAAPAFLKRPAVPPGAIDCPVDEKGLWSCSLPAATFDLKISAAGFIPQYRWQTQVRAGKTLPLGTIALERGASVAGFATVEGGALEEGNCVARLKPLFSGGGDPGRAIALEQTAIEQPVRRDGFFQLVGVPPGNYSLEVRQPGYSPAKVSPLRIEPRKETWLRDPLVLTYPLDLAFVVQPALDWLGQPWHARLSRAREAEAIAPIVFDGAVGKDGRFTVQNQSAGRFTLSIADSLDNRLYLNDRLLLDGATATPVPIEIQLIDVAGHLHLGDRPLAGTVWFGGRSGGMRTKMVTDQEGRFHGVLPRGGGWPIEIESTSPNFLAQAEVVVDVAPAGKSTLDIDLPDTRLFGRVLDKTDKPVTHAEVLVEGKGPLQHVGTEEMGTFELRGLPPGAARVSAAVGSRTSETLPVSVAEGQDVGPIELHLGSAEKWSGSVISAQGPVAGSRIVLQAAPPANGGAIATSGIDGTFTAELPAGIHQVIAYVSSPGFPFQVIGPLDVSAMALKLSDEGGTLKVSLPLSGDDFLRQSLGLSAELNGLPLPMMLLRQWALEQGESGPNGQSTFQVPNVMNGAYRICVVPRERIGVLRSGGDLGASAVCDSGVLAPGATLTLKP